MARRTKLDAEKTRKQILDAAEILFFDKGVSDTSLADIALAAGVTRGAIYWHFKNKADLFHAMHMRVALPLDHMLAETSGDADPIYALRDFWIKNLQQILADEQKLRVIEILLKKCEYVKEFEQEQERIREWSCVIVRNMAQIFMKAEKEGLLREGMSPESAAKSTYCLITGILYHWLPRYDGSPVFDASPVIALFFQSLHRATA